MFRILDATVPSAARLSESTEDVSHPPAGVVRWIDLSAQDAPQLQLLSERFGFHPLTIEDCLHFDQRPKLEAYPNYLFLVVHGFYLKNDDCNDGEPLELHMFLTKDCLITVHQSPLPALDGLWNRVVHAPELLLKGPDFACYLLCDAIVDHYFPILDELALKVDEIEERVLEEHQRLELSEIFQFKRVLVKLRKVLSPQRDVLALLAKRGEGWIAESTAVYFRDVYDHVLRLHESVEATRDLLSNALDAYLWSASQRTNEIMKRLTVLSAIFLPLTFITGFFGQNFEGLPFADNRIMWFMVATCILVPAGMMLYFVRSKWF